MDSTLTPVITEAVRAFAIVIIPCLGALVVTGFVMALLQATTTVREEGMVFAAKLLVLLVVIVVLYPTFFSALQSVYLTALQ